MGGGEGGFIEAGVVVEGEEVVVDVASGEGWGGYVCCMLYGVFDLSASRETVDGLEADCLHVAPAF